MTTVIQSARDRLLREVADDYIRQGFPVQIEPAPAELPEFLREYRPDLVVTTPQGHIVVGVRSERDIRDADYWRRVQEAVDAHADWRFQFVVDSRREKELLGTELPVLNGEEAELRLLASQQLADSGLLDSALVVAWSTLEGVLRAVSREEGLELPDQGSAPLITAMYAEGSLERSDYDALMRILRARNKAVHGFRVQDMNRSFVEQTQEITRRLLAQERRAA